MPNEQSGYFKEIQRFDQPWLGILLIVAMLLLLGLFGYGMFQQLVQGVPWGDRPLSDRALLTVGIASLLFFGGILILFRSLRLITEVRPDGLSVRFHPLRHKLIPYRRIKSCEARTYRPLWEYGGWGSNSDPVAGPTMSRGNEGCNWY